MTMDKKLDKQTVLAGLKSLLNEDKVSKGEVLDLLESPKRKKRSGIRGRLSFQQIFYFVGAMVVVLGVAIFVGQFWADIPQAVQLIFALGLSGLLYYVGYAINQLDGEVKIFSAVSFIVSALLLPLGIGTFLDMLGLSLSANQFALLLGTLSLSVYLPSYLSLDLDIFLIFSFMAGSAAYLGMTGPLAESGEFVINAIRVMVLGISYVSLGRYLYNQRGEGRAALSLLNFAGYLLVLGAGFALNVEEQGIWMLLFSPLLAGIYYLSVKFGDKMVLGFATLFTFAEIAWLTGEFFSDSLGWPIALIFAGFGIITVRYFSFRVSKEFD